MMIFTVDTIYDTMLYSLLRMFVLMIRDDFVFITTLVYGYYFDFLKGDHLLFPDSRIQKHYSKNKFKTLNTSSIYFSQYINLKFPGGMFYESVG